MTTTSIRFVLVAFGAGVAFSVALALGGMTQPDRVQGFLDVFGAWDPTLAFFMGGALLLYGGVYRWTRRRTRRRGMATAPTGRIDRKLLVGAGLFGLGWGAAGFCPAPAITSLASGSSEALVFFGGMVLGIYAKGLFAELSWGRRERPSNSAAPLADAWPRPTRG